ncbi:MAG: hypothetical protein JNK85_11940 [Verrucomicrobiales bacterium]|nr:hypothetical protein [Verrucomicrobiales bacterium]
MEALAELAGWVFGWLLRNSAHACALAALVYGLELVAGRHLAPRWRYGLWLVVLARLLVPVAPESHLSLFNLVDFAPAGLSGAALQVLGLPAPVVVPAIEPPHPLADTPTWFVWALALWCPGALVLSGLIWRDHRRLRQALAATSPVESAEVQDLLRQSKGVMSVRRRIAVEETGQISSPAIAGCWRPRLLLPSGLLERLTPDEIRFLFLHELAHVKRADIALNWLLAAIQVLHWFNPAVWLALRRLLAVREEVCDDLVLRRSFPGASREYALTLLRLLEECAPRRVVPSLAGVLDDLGTLRRRMRCIRDFQRLNPNPWIPAALTVTVAIVGLTERIPEPLSWGLGPAEERTAEMEPRLADATRRSGAVAGGKARPESESTLTSRPRNSSRVVGTLTTALQKATPSSSSYPAGNGRASQAQAVMVTGSSTIRTVTTAPRPQSQRPFPLPPVGERGSVLDPPRPLDASGVEVPKGRVLDVVPYFGRQVSVGAKRSGHGS